MSFLNPVMTKFFKSSHPIPPDPITRSLLSWIRCCISSENNHVGLSKSLSAKETIDKFMGPNLGIELTAYHDNIKAEKFDLSFFKTFDLVFNALDNIEARRYVNRMCITANLPLLEAGTQGFNGQVQTIIHGKTACYECEEKQTPKSFPVCTIRSTPDRPIHCITWAKFLYELIFG